MLLDFLAGLVLLVIGAELLVRGASRLAAAAGIPPLVVGLTVVAFGTSAPEMAVSVGASLQGDPDIALGNAVGSNIFNVLFILGVAALLAPLGVGRRLVRQEVPLMIGVSALLVVLVLDGGVGQVEGVFLFLGILVFTAVLAVRGRREGMAPEDAPERDAGAGGFGGGALALLAVAAGLVALVLGARWLVAAAQEMAGVLGVPERVVALTIVAAGTSLPELATSVVATLRGQRDIAVGNIVGSNIFNILAIVGLAAAVSPAGVAVAPTALAFDLPVMVAVAVVCLPVFLDGHISRWEGALFLLFYALYLLYLGLHSIGRPPLPPLAAAMVGFVVPLTVLTLVVAVATVRRRAR